MPSLDFAVIIAVPSPTAVTFPSFTVATLLLLDSQYKTLSVTLPGLYTTLIYPVFALASVPTCKFISVVFKYIEFNFTSVGFFVDSGILLYTGIINVIFPSKLSAYNL